MTTTARDLQRADALVTEQERAQSSVLRGMRDAANSARQATLDRSNDQQLAAYQAARTKIDYAAIVAESPQLAAKAQAELDKLEPALRGRELPPPPPRDPRLRDTSTPTLLDAADSVTALARSSGRDDDRTAAQSLQNELLARRVEMIRGERPVGEFTQRPGLEQQERSDQVARAISAVRTDQQRER